MRRPKHAATYEINKFRYKIESWPVDVYYCTWACDMVHFWYHGNKWWSLWLGFFILLKYFTSTTATEHVGLRMGGVSLVGRTFNTFPRHMCLAHHYRFIQRNARFSPRFWEDRPCRVQTWRLTIYCFEVGTSSWTLRFQVDQPIYLSLFTVGNDPLPNSY